MSGRFLFYATAGLLLLYALSWFGAYLWLENEAEESAPITLTDFPAESVSADWQAGPVIELNDESKQLLLDAAEMADRLESIEARLAELERKQAQP